MILRLPAPDTMSPKDICPANGRKLMALTQRELLSPKVEGDAVGGPPVSSPSNVAEGTGAQEEEEEEASKPSVEFKCPPELIAAFQQRKQKRVDHYEARKRSGSERERRLQAILGASK